MNKPSRSLASSARSRLLLLHHFSGRRAQLSFCRALQGAARTPVLQGRRLFLNFVFTSLRTISASPVLAVCAPPILLAIEPPACHKPLSAARALLDAVCLCLVFFPKNRSLFLACGALCLGRFISSTFWLLLFSFYYPCFGFGTTFKHHRVLKMPQSTFSFGCAVVF